MPNPIIHGFPARNMKQEKNALHKVEKIKDFKNSSKNTSLYVRGKSLAAAFPFLICGNRICFIDLNLFNKTNVVLDLPYVKECDSMFYEEWHADG